MKQEKYKVYLHLGINQNNMTEILKNTENKLKY